jgi:hypothetical protein
MRVRFERTDSGVPFAPAGLEQALDWVESRDVSCYVPVTESAPESGAAERLLRGRGYERGLRTQRRPPESNRCKRLCRRVC